MRRAHDRGFNVCAVRLKTRHEERGNAIEDRVCSLRACRLGLGIGDVCFCTEGIIFVLGFASSAGVIEKAIRANSVKSNE